MTNTQNVSPYSGCCIILTTKHQKSIALAQPFERILNSIVLEHVADTDQLGTFSGEIERKKTAFETVREKCEWSIEHTEADYALASEGSFGPHPMMPLIPGDHEFLYFIDRKHDFHLCISDVYMETNYESAEISTLDDLLEFADKTRFPSHALIVRPMTKTVIEPIFKGLETQEDLETAFNEAQRRSPNRKVWVETDMRAHMNPTRMNMIGILGEKLAHRLTSHCPKCQTPGWGMVDHQAGLPCKWCGSSTPNIKTEIFGCTRCDYRESRSPAHGTDHAQPLHCTNCNP